MFRSLPTRGPSRTRPLSRALSGPVALLVAALLALPGAAAAQATADSTAQAPADSFPSIPGCAGGAVFLKNYAPVTVDYGAGPDLRVESLAPGESTSHCTEEGELRLRLLDSGRTYAVAPGGHHFWWVEEEGRFGLDFDSNYFIPGPLEEREYRLENRLDTPVPFRLDGKFRRLDDGRALTLTWTSRWQPQVTYRADDGIRVYRVDEPCFAFAVVSADGRAGFAVCD